METCSSKVIFLSHWFGNPYKTLLIHGLKSKGVEVRDDYRTDFFLQKFLDGWQAKILHTHDLHTFFSARSKFKLLRLVKFCLFITQLLILKLIGVKIVWTVHEWKDRFEGGKRDLPKSYCLILSYLIDAAIVHCKTTYQEIISAFDWQQSGKVFVIPHGNYVGVFKNDIQQTEARKLLGIPQENVVFLLFGFIQPSKGFLEAISAFKKLPQQKVNLVIAGHPADQALVDLIQREVEGYSNIHFNPQRIPDDEIQIYMNACDCAVVPYKVFTTSGITVLSMSYGKACIAPKLGFFTDVLDSQGSFLYEASEPDGLQKAMQAILEKQDSLTAMGQHNLELAKAWDWDGIADKTYQIYCQCCGI